MCEESKTGTAGSGADGAIGYKNGIINVLGGKPKTGIAGSTECLAASPS